MGIQSLKKIVKRSIQIAALQLGRHRKKHTSPQLIVIMYHRVLPKDDLRRQTEEPGMFVSPDTFELHLKILSQYFKFISLSEWLEKKASLQPLPDMACAITFDDGWRDNYEYAYPILKRYNIPATIYLVANMVGTKQIFWPERIAQLLISLSQQKGLWNSNSFKWLKSTQTSYAFNDTEPDKEQISQIIHSLKQYTDKEIIQRLDDIEPMIPLKSANAENTAILNWSEVNEMLASGIIEIGSHTCQHIRLNANTSADVLNSEIAHSKQIIKEKTNTEIKTFCFPNGDYSAEAVALVKKHYIGSVTTKFGWNSLKTEPYLLHRISVHEDVSNNTASFLSRLSGWT